MTAACCWPAISVSADLDGTFSMPAADRTPRPPPQRTPPRMSGTYTCPAGKIGCAPSPAEHIRATAGNGSGDGSIAAAALRGALAASSSSMMMMPCGAAGLLAVAVCVVPWPASWPAPSKLPLALALAYDRCTDVDRLRIYAVTLIAVTLLVFLLWDLLLADAADVLLADADWGAAGRFVKSLVPLTAWAKAGIAVKIWWSSWRCALAFRGHCIAAAEEEQQQALAATHLPPHTTRQLLAQERANEAAVALQLPSGGGLLGGRQRRSTGVRPTSPGALRARRESLLARLSPHNEDGTVGLAGLNMR
jgi:hypothetical protein